MAADPHHSIYPARITIIQFTELFFTALPPLFFCPPQERRDEITSRANSPPACSPDLRRHPYIGKLAPLILVLVLLLPSLLSSPSSGCLLPCPGLPSGRGAHSKIADMVAGPGHPPFAAHLRPQPGAACRVEWLRLPTCAGSPPLLGPPPKPGAMMMRGYDRRVMV